MGNLAWGFAIQTFFEVFFIGLLFIGFLNIEKVTRFEHRIIVKLCHFLYLIFNRKSNRHKPQKHRKRANIGDYDCYEDVRTRAANWEPKYNKNDFNGEGKQ